MKKGALQKWDKWRKSLEEIKKELERLYFAKGMFERLNSHKKVVNCPDQCFSLYLIRQRDIFYSYGTQLFNFLTFIPSFLRRFNLLL